MRNPAWLMLAIGVLLGLSACDNGSGVAAPQPGQYSGFYNHEVVSATLKRDSDQEFTLIFSSPTNSQQTWTFDLQASGGVKLGDGQTSESYSVPDDTGCSSSKSANGTLRLCWSADEIHWAQLGSDGAMLASLDLTRLLSDEMPTLEKPQRYGLDELVTRAQARNFKSVVDFRKMVLAKTNALNADLNLLPHANATDALNILSGSLYTELKSIGDLVPFLLPDRWFRAAAANDMAAAEKDSWRIMDLDGVNYVESFAYASARDGEALASMAKERALVAGLRDFVRGKEQAGLAPLGTSDDLSSLVNQIDRGSTGLQVLQSDELAALSQAAGFFNPVAVSGVDFHPDPSAPWAGSPITVDFDAAAPLAVSRAVELRQMDDLLAWAKNEAHAKIFDWMDPSGDSSGGVGLGLPSYIEAGIDEENVIVAQTDVVRSDLLNHLQDAILQLQKEASDYQLAVQAVEIQQRRVLRNTYNLKVGIGFTMSDLIEALQDQMNSELAQIDAEYGYQLALSRFNRILCQGTYAPSASAQRE